MIRASQLHYEISHAYIWFANRQCFFEKYRKNHFRFGYPFRNIQVEKKIFWWIDLHFNTHSCLYKWGKIFPTDFVTLPEYISESKNYSASPVPFFHPHGIIRVKWKIFSIFGCVFLSSPDYISEQKKFSRIVGCVFDTQIVYSRGDTVPFESPENNGRKWLREKKNARLLAGAVETTSGSLKTYLIRVFLLSFRLSAF